jgi:hypothetical protein
MITTGQIAYYDQYGAVAIRGYRFFAYGGGAGEVYSINPSNGEILYGTGFFC